MKSLFERAEEFIWHNARLLERRLFYFDFRSGSAQAVLFVLRAYQNEDGGFGNALEQEIRANLEEIVAGQQEGGGWGITRAPVSPACETEWRC